jgi:LuxR family maltose regulon positive regulatory protein
MTAEAVEHAMAAGDLASAGELVSAGWIDVFSRGEVATVVRWIEALPAEMLRADPGLALAAAWALRGVGRLDETEAFLDEAERAGEAAGGPLADGTASVASGAAMVRALVRLAQGDVGAAAEAAERASAGEPDERSRWHSTAWMTLGVARHWQGRPAEARAALERAARVGLATGSHPAALIALGRLAVITLDEEGPEAGLAAARTAVAHAEEHGMADYPHAGAAHVALGRALLDHGRVDEAEEPLLRALAVSRRGRARLTEMEVEVALARLRRAQGRPAEARAHLARAREGLAGCPDPGVLPSLLARAGAARGPAPAGGDGPGAELTARELALLALLPTGLSQREIASRLYVSPNTVKTHLRGVYRKLGAAGRAEAVARARDLGLLGAGEAEPAPG